MAKEKKSAFDDEKKDLTFYYEIIGVIALILTILAIANLGTVGFYLGLGFKVFFGDWYFLIIIAMGLFGLHCLIFHSPLRIKNMRSIGVILLLIGLLMLAHFPMHDYITEFDGNELSLTFSLYLDYFKSYQSGMVLGGGIVGSLFFYLSYVLFSGIGTVVVIFILLFVGVSFTCKKTVSEFTLFWWKGFKRMTKGGKKVLKSLKYDIKRPVKERKEVTKVTSDILDQPLKLKYLSGEEVHAESLLKTIQSVLRLSNTPYTQLKYLISYLVTSFSFIPQGTFDEHLFNEKLSGILSEEYLIKRERNSSTVIIEFNNLVDNPINLATLISMDNRFFNSWVISVGVTTSNALQTCELSSPILIVGPTYLHHVLIVQLLIKNKESIGLRYYNLSNPDDLFEATFYRNDFLGDLPSIKKAIDERLHKLNQTGCNSILEYNQKNEKLLHEIIVINGIEEVLSKGETIAEDLLYLIQLGQKAGYSFIFKLNADSVIPNIILGTITARIFFPNDFTITKKSLGVDTTSLKNNEAITLSKDVMRRVATPTLSEKEKEKFLKIFREKK